MPVELNHAVAAMMKQQGVLAEPKSETVRDVTQVHDRLKASLGVSTFGELKDAFTDPFAPVETEHGVTTKFYELVDRSVAGVQSNDVVFAPETIEQGFVEAGVEIASVDNPEHASRVVEWVYTSAARATESSTHANKYPLERQFWAKLKNKGAQKPNETVVFQS